MSQQQDPKGVKDTNKLTRLPDDVTLANEGRSDDTLTEQVLNEEDQQNSVNPMDTPDARGAFLDLHANAGPGDDDEGEEDEDAGVTNPGTEIDIPYPDSDDDAAETTRKIPSL